ncbi:MAG TPA: GNAT family N-acetyltransferase [Pseudomonadales bacterium]|nr:GNAT family N-acetyltransferase [Pseudomonadales bacterium]
MNMLEDRYPRTHDFPDGSVTLSRMTPADEQEIVAFAATLPPHDLLFLRRNINEPRVVAAWMRELDEGTITSLIARRDGRIIGTTAVVVDPHSWSPHVGELRVLLSREDRAEGLGRLLIQESFLLAIALGLEKLTAQMTPDQQAAIAVFEDLGFRGEAMLRDQVRDGAGAKHDIVVLGHDVLRFQAQLEAYGVSEAF